jgi:hypothetical protein
VDYTATVGTVLAGGGTPTGSVVFAVSNSFLGAGSFTVPVTNGVATLAGHVLDGGDNTITATYVPNSPKWSASASAPQSQLVNRWTTTMTVRRSAATSAWGQSVTFDALVNLPPGAPKDGTVAFYVNGTAPGNLAIRLPLDQFWSTATWTTPYLPVGDPVDVYVLYEGTVNYTHAGWIRETQAVSTAPTLTTLQSPTSTAPWITATVTPAVAGSIIPQGYVQFSLDGGPYMTARFTIDATGKAYLPIAGTFRRGTTHRVRARFTGSIIWWKTSQSTSLTFVAP